MNIRFKLFLVLLIPVVLFLHCTGLLRGKTDTQPDILLITIDTLRSDHVSAYGYPRNTTPFIDSLAHEGLMFKQTITPQPQTSGSHATILTSQHPLTHGLIFNALNLPETTQSIAEVLQKNGYYTIGTVSVGILSGKFKFSRGFDSFSDRWEIDPQYEFLKRDQRVAQRVNEALFEQIGEYRSKHKDKPFFIWVHYYDPHAPYIGRETITFKQPLPSHHEKYGKMLEDYDREIRYTDDHIKQLYRFLEERKMTKRLLTCIVADHGEEFGEHGFRQGHYDFYAETTHVPLIFHGYGIPKHKVVNRSVSTMDISVSLLAKANLTFANTTDGIDLFQMLAKNPSPGKDKRNHLIIGTQKWSRSLQLLGMPHSFILNFDNHYRFWYLSMIPQAKPAPIPDSQFKRLSPSQVEAQNHKYTIKIPPMREKGLYYLVLRTDLKIDPNALQGNETTKKKQAKKKSPHIKFQIETYPQFLSKIRSLSMPSPPTSQSAQQKPQWVEIIYPVTIVDSIKIHMNMKKAGASLSGYRYTFVKKEELSAYFAGLSEVNGPYQTEIMNFLWGVLGTRRKNKGGDQFFDLTLNRTMKTNLIETRKLKPLIINYKLRTYKTYEYYKRRHLRFQKGKGPDRKLSKEDKDMLKSLGYL